METSKLGVHHTHLHKTAATKKHEQFEKKNFMLLARKVCSSSEYLLTQKSHASVRVLRSSLSS